MWTPQLIDCSSLLCHEGGGGSGNNDEGNDYVFGMTSSGASAVKARAWDDDEEDANALFFPLFAEQICEAQVDIDESISFLIVKEGTHSLGAEYVRKLKNHSVEEASRQIAVQWLRKALGSISSIVVKETAHALGAEYVGKLKNHGTNEVSRLIIVECLLKVHTFYRFGPITAVLAVNYVDRFMSRYANNHGKSWMAQLLSITCLSLAAKMEEPIVPLLLDLQEGSEYIFEPRTIQRMELLVLSTLDWQMSSVTPFSYIDKFILKLGIEERYWHSLVPRISDLILDTLKETKFLEYPPSAVATAAFFCAIQELLPLQFLRHQETIFLNPSISKDACVGCFRLMDNLFVEPLLRPSISKRPYYDKYTSSSNSLSPLRVLEASFSYASESNAKSESRANIDSSSVAASSKKRRVVNTIVHRNEIV